jgi:apolipoprotein N-acyltransferase
MTRRNEGTISAHDVGPQDWRGYTPALRVALLVLRMWSCAALLGVGFLLFFSEAPPNNPLQLTRLIALNAVTPWALAALLDWYFSARVLVGSETLNFELRNRRVEVPLDSITAVKPLVIPFPAHGVQLVLGSGRVFNFTLCARKYGALVERIVAMKDLAPERTAWSRAVENYAAAFWAGGGGAALAPRRMTLKFVVFALVPTLPLFRVHQFIAYGGTFGEYYQYGLGAYAGGFALYWGTLISYLLIYSAVLRLAVEVLAMVSAFANPHIATRTRRVAQRTADFAYFGGVIAVIILRLWPW